MSSPVVSRLGPWLAAAINGVLLFGILLAVLEAMTWAAAGLTGAPPAITFGAEGAAAIAALALSAWWAVRAFRAESRLAAGLDP